MPPPESPSPDELKELFPRVTKPPKSQTFEVGLVLGGTVSAGAFTGGALDLLFEAMDRWHEPGAPLHDVTVTVAAGSSGGAVCAALVGILSNRRFEHVTGPENDVGLGARRIQNQLWNTWVESFSFDKLTTDLSDLNEPINENSENPNDNKQRTPSILNSRMLVDSADEIVRLAVQPPDFERRWIAKPLRVGVTVTNLRGVPYRTEAPHLSKAYRGSAFVQHDDFVWFAVPSWLQSPSDVRPKRPDEFWVDASVAGYQTLAHWSTASGAMPVGLRARPLSRPPEHYLYRPRVRPITNAAGRPDVVIDWPDPDWNEIPEIAHGQDYGFSAVDGGTFNNDPVRLVHVAMAGLIGQNPREPQAATRAIFMIDPLVDQPTRLAKIGLSLTAVAGAMLNVLVGGVRYLTADVESFANKEVFSRFQLVPSRRVEGTQIVGQDALAGSGLLAFGGWCSRKYRVHDFFLGRANMRRYLAHDFILRADNALFASWHKTDQGKALRRKYASNKEGEHIEIGADTPPDGYYLPIIPVDDEIQADQPEWPIDAVDLKAFEVQLRARLKAVLKVLREDNFPGFGPWLLALIAVPVIACQAARKLTGTFRQDLRRRKLLSP